MTKREKGEINKNWYYYKLYVQNKRQSSRQKIR